MKVKGIALFTLIVFSALIATGFAVYNNSTNMRQDEMNHNHEGHHNMMNMDMEEMHRQMQQMMNTTHMEEHQHEHGCH